MELKVERIICGSFQTNTYILYKGNDVVIIDPACKIDKLDNYLENKKVLAVLLTHGHFDHIKTVDSLYKKYNMPIYINHDDEYLIRNKRQALVFGIDEAIYVSSPCKYFEEKELKIGDFIFDILFTKGHTMGSVCIRCENILFTGDTLFRLSVGRTDLDGGSVSDLKKSLKIIREINENLLVYPGHDEISDLDFEKNNNIYLKS